MDIFIIGVLSFVLLFSKYWLIKMGFYISEYLNSIIGDFGTLWNIVIMIKTSRGGF